MGFITEGMGSVLGYLFMRQLLWGRYMAEDIAPLGERAVNTVASMVAQDEITLKANAQRQMVATLCLGLIVVLTTIGVLVLSVMRIEIPPSLSAVGGTAIGALVATLNNQQKR